MKTMDLDTESICRLCLEASDDVVNIWSTFHDSTIASILSKHFWFQIHKNDGLTESLCQVCWFQTKTFHQFYQKAEQLQKRFLDSVNSFNKDVSDKHATRTNDGIDAELQPDLNEVKCEETKLIAATISTQISGEDSSDDDNVSDECEEKKTTDGELEKTTDGEEEKTADDEEEAGQNSTNDKKKYDDDVLSPIIIRKGYLSRSEKVELDRQIRGLFNMKCEICSDDVKFETLLKAKQHYRDVHETQGYITCCNKKFFERRMTIQHIRNHIYPDAYRCHQCNKTFKNEGSLKIHIGTHVPLDSREFKCSLCRSSFAKACILKKHVLNKHTSKTGEKFPCDKCGKKSNLLLGCHIRQVHELTDEHMCEVCARTFKTKTALQHHISHEHSTTPPPKVQCKVCGIWLKSLRYHRALHETLHPVKCPICKKEVRDKRLLDNHIKYVHCEKRYPCTLCDKAFKVARRLKEHIATHTGEDLYSCRYCDKKFKSDANMYKHRKLVHLAEWTQDCRQHNKTSTKVSAELSA